jgi:hypothetical protein
MAARDHLRVRALAHDGGDAVAVPAQAENLGLCAHVPDLEREKGELDDVEEGSTLAVESLAQVTSTSKVGCSARSWTALRWPW